MDNLLLRSSKDAHLKYLEDLLKVLLKSSVKISLKKHQLFRSKLNIWVTPLLSKAKESVLKHHLLELQ